MAAILSRPQCDDVPSVSWNHSDSDLALEHDISKLAQHYVSSFQKGQIQIDR